MPWAVGGGGSVAVFGSKNFKKYQSNEVMQYVGHKGFIQDLQFSPFHDNCLATASADASIKIWMIPEDGLSSNVSQSDVDLNGHIKKVGLLDFHPASEFTLASAGFEGSVKIWDIQNESS